MTDAGKEGPVLYRVRTADGTLDYPSLGDLERAFTSGLVSREDDVFDVKAGAWKKAKSIPALVHPRVQKRAASLVPYPWLVALTLALAVGALYLLSRPSNAVRGMGLLLALAAASLFTQVTVKAFRRGKAR